MIVVAIMNADAVNKEGTVQSWVVNPIIAGMILAMLGEPHMEQVFEAGHVALANQLAETMPTINNLDKMA